MLCNAQKEPLKSSMWNVAKRWIINTPIPQELIIPKNKTNMYADFGHSQFPDEDKDDPQNILLTNQPPDSAASPRIFY